ncbi:MAG: polysaccharide biosynthesis protein [Woeseiaceae bacterium]
MTAESLRRQVLALPRLAKQALMMLTDVVGLTICTTGTLWLLFDGFSLMPNILQAIIVGVSLSLLVAWQFGFYHSIVRYIGPDVVVAATKTALGSAALVTLAVFLTSQVAAPARLFIVYFAFALIYVLGSRTAARLLLNRRGPMQENVIVYGAGSAGSRLAIALYGGESYVPVAMVDDDRRVHGKQVSGLEVHAPEALPELIERLRVTKILLALPSIPRRRRKAIIKELEALPVRLQIMPEIDDLVSGRSRVDDLRDVDVVDLLGRETVPPNRALLGSTVADQSVMVTGAGGSIGSELCRQIILQRPKSLILLEISEAALYEINAEMCGIAAREEIPCEIFALLGSAHQQDRVLEVMQTFEVNTVFHAAAYKHVPVVEQNIIEGIRNNVFGTMRTASAAIAAGVDNFVLISTDKAVSPTNVMGATKRLAELTLQALQDGDHATRFSMVRFGNVLASSGSVVPLFRQQIRDGGPVTVTHREIIRYFMTIPEAAELVIQASAMARGGDVFVLDMGQPVRIRDLAHRMIRLSGLTVRDEENPEGDIEIRYTGLRPAEKLYEELLIGANTSETEHPRIMRAMEDYLPKPELDRVLDELHGAIRNRDREKAREMLLHSVSEYQPAAAIEDLVWKSRDQFEAQPTVLVAQNA